MPTQTVTYDPSNDTIIEEQNDARDAENLEIGEKMVAEQENLLAGKYKTTEDLEKGYKELEQKLGEKDKGLEREESKTETEEPTDTEPYLAHPETGEKLNPYGEDGSINYEEVNNVYGDKLGQVFKDAELDPWAISKEFHENRGTLSDEKYNSLIESGLSKSAVDAYLKGRAEQSGYLNQTEEAAAPTLSESEISDVKNIAGGEKGYEQLMTWATSNMSDQDAAAFDEVIETGNKAAVTFAVKALMGQFEDAQGRDSDLITGKASKTVTYRSMAEVVRDMNNPLYDSDESYRDDVRRKLEASNLKV